MLLPRVCQRILIIACSLAASSTLPSVCIAAPDDPDESGGRNGSVYVDPLGLLLFGPTLGVEARVEPMTVGAYVRWLSAGVLARSMFPNENEEFAFSYGIGLRGRHYFGEDMSGALLGLAVEYLSSRIAGYRLDLGTLFLGGTAGLGYAAELSADVEDLPGGTRAALFEPEDASTIYGGAAFEIGAYF